MIMLSNGCTMSEIKVTPKNWDKKTADINREWVISYRFYDPTIPKPMRVQIRAGINYIKDLKDRQTMVRALVAEEYRKLKDLGYSPITGTYQVEQEIEYEIDPQTPVIAALKKALEKLICVDHTKKDIRSVIRGVEKAALQLRFNNLEISKISRRHIKMLLERVGANNPKWSARRYNMYRSYLLMLFKELVELEAVTANPVRDISKMKEFKRLRPVLTNEQREAIKEHLADTDQRFLAFVNLFFHSGARLTELVQIRAKDVDMKRQVYKTTIRKGKFFEEKERTIKDVAVEFWQVFLRDAKPDDYIFGIDFLPAAKPMVSDTITRRWRRLVIKELKINISLYSLKHLNLSETVDRIGSEGAAAQAGHTSTSMVENVYDVRKGQRDHEALKRVGNRF